MNWETILVALIAALGPLIGTLISNSQQKALLKLKMETLEGNVKSLSDKVDKHNNFDRRLVAIETKLDMKQEEEKK